MAHLSEVRGPAFKIAEDPRITKVGRFLRRTSLDELPQLWNVLRGEMSIVGPRPAPPREVAQYSIWHRRRLGMRPGLTGLWQVSARSESDFDRRVAARSRLHRPLVTVDGHQDPPPDDPGGSRSGRPLTGRPSFGSRSARIIAGAPGICSHSWSSPRPACCCARTCRSSRIQTPATTTSTVRAHSPSRCSVATGWRSLRNGSRERTRIPSLSRVDLLPAPTSETGRARDLPWWRASSPSCPDQARAW